MILTGNAGVEGRPGARIDEVERETKNRDGAINKRPAFLEKYAERFDRRLGRIEQQMDIPALESD